MPGSTSRLATSSGCWNAVPSMNSRSARVDNAHVSVAVTALARSHGSGCRGKRLLGLPTVVWHLLRGVVGDVADVLLRRNEVSDISSLSGLTELTYMSLSGGNSVSDVSPLTG